MSNHLDQPLLRSSILGYILTEELYTGSRTAVYRALADADTQSSPVVIKILRSPHPSFNDLVCFRNQFIIAKTLAIPGIVKPLTLGAWNHRYALVMEDVGALALRDYLRSQGRLSVTQVMAIALQLSDTLHHLSQHRVLHKDITPAHILIHPDTHQIWLTDFSVASLLPKESQELSSPRALEGTLAYNAPEQTGRMNRGIDYRTDFYSLGVTLYELLAGRLPFQSNDPMELIHCHIAKIPVPPCEVSDSLPRILSDIVLKLMAKNAEDRYQSALGLKHDLQQCLNQWEASEKIEPFELGQRDVCDRFLIPEKLYGRALEIQTLLDTFERVAQGSSELMLVAGFSGIGKTAVINEVHKPITQQKGYFIKGKFDQFNRNIPLSAFVQAFRSLMGQLLGESDADLAAWKNRILATVEENGQVLIEVIPELEKIIGLQPAISELPGTAAQNRFNLLFGKFIQLFTTPEHPLVIFLDDLQWADSASLGLIKLLMDETENRTENRPANKPKNGYLLILGAYRDNEVSPNHPLVITLDALKRQTNAPSTLTLEPLSQEHIYQLVADALRCDPDVAAPLAQLVYHNTQGNPFFTTQFLQELHNDGVISFDETNGVWQCNLRQVGELAITDDVVSFMVARLRQLPAATQEVLQLSACIGNHFDLQTLAVVCECSQAEVAGNLWPALQMGLVVPANDAYQFLQSDLKEIEPTDVLADGTRVAYRFLHDCVQQSAYALVPADQKSQIHYHLGQLLTREISKSSQETRIFELVTHLNHGSEYVALQSFRDDVAQLNLKACQKAKRTIAYQAGYGYAAMGLSWLGSGAWERQYDLSLALCNFAAEFAWLCGDLAAMTDHIQTILQQSHSLLDQIPAYCLQIQSDTSQMQFAEALMTARDVLGLLGVTLPSTETIEDVATSVADTEQILCETSLADLATLPVMRQRSDIAVIQIISQVIPPAYICGSPLFPSVVILATRLLVQAGNLPLSAYIYANYAYILCHYCQDIEASEDFGQLALRLANEPEAKSVRPQVYVMLALYMQHRKSPLRETLDLARWGYIFAQEVGNQEWAGYSAYAFCANGFASAHNLIDLDEMTQDYCVNLMRFKQVASANWCQIYRQAIFTLTHASGQQQKIFFSSPEQEASFLSDLHKAEDLLGLFHFHLCKLVIHYLFGDIEAAHHHALEARARLDVAQGIVGLPVFYFYDSLVLLRQLIEADISPEGREKTLQQVDSNQEKLKQDWAQYAPVNYQHKVKLVQAEKFAYLGERWAALEFYDDAISAAKTHDYRQEEALANELAAKFYLSCDKEKVAAGYMQEAYCGYSRWGAKAKTEHLEQQYAELLQPNLREIHSSGSLETFETLESATNFNLSGHASAASIPSSSNTQLDFAAVLKSAQLLSEKIQLDELLTQLTQLMLHNSGADKLAVVLPTGDNAWQVRAIATPETTQLLTEPFRDYSTLPTQLIQYVKNTQELIVIDKLDTELPIIDTYLQQRQPQSVLCLPLLHQGNLNGLVYLEHQSVAGVFSGDRITLLNFLCTQAAISLDNAQLYHTLEQRVEARTRALQESQHELTDYIENAATSLHWVDASGIIIWANQTELDFLGYGREEYIGQPIANFHADEAVGKDIFMRLSNHETLVNYEARLCCKDGSIRYVQINSSAFYRDGEFVHTRCFTSDITERKTAEMALNDLVAGTAATIGEDFFPALVRHISVALGVPIALVTQFVDQELQSLAFVVDGELQPNFTYNLPDTPCRDLVVDYTYHCPSDLSKHFPNHPHRARGVDSYLGVALRDRQGQVLGSLCIFDRQSLQEPERARQILNVFAARAAAELERQRAEQEMERLNRDLEQRVRDRTAQLADSEERLRTLFNQAADAVFLLGDHGFIDCNQSAVALLRYPSKSELLARQPHQISPERQPDGQLSDTKAQLMVQEALQRGSFQFEWVHQRADGENFWAEITITPIRYQEEVIYHGIARDISDRKQLQQEQARLTAVLEATPDFIGIANAQGEILWHNKPLRELRADLGDFEDHRSLEDCHPDWVNKIIREEALPTAIQQGSWSGELALLDGDGNEIPISQVIIAHKSTSGEIENFSTIMRDIRVIKRTEAALKLSEARAQATFTQAAVGFVEVSLKTKKCVRVNNWFCDMLGYSRAELTEMTVSEITHPDDIPASVEAIKQLHHGEVDSFTIEKRYIRKDGTLFWAETTCYMIKHQSGEDMYSVALIQDISEKRRLEAERQRATLDLQLSEARASSAFEQAAVGIAESNLTDGKITRTNNYFCQITGYTAQELRSLTGAELTHPDDLSDSRGQVKQLYTGQIDSFTLEKRYLCKDGSYFWATTAVSLIQNPAEDSPRCLAVVQDISDRKRYEQQLQDLSERLELAIESAQVGIWEWDCQTDCLSWDDRMFEIYGLRPEVFGGTYQDWENCVHPEDLAQVVAQKQDYNINGEKRYTIEFRIIRPDGTVRYILATASIQRDAQGEATRTVGTNLDITDRKTAELALRDSQAQFQRITENVPGVIFRFVLHPDGSNELTYVSSKIREVFEVEPEAALQDTAHTWARVHPDDIPRLVEAIQVSAKTLQPFSCEHRLILPEKGLRWVQYMSHPSELDNGDVVWDGMAFDISDRKVAELALQDSQAQFQRMTENVPGMIFRYVLHPDGSDEITYISSQVREVFEVEPEVALQDTAHTWERIHPDDIPRLVEAVQASAETLEPFTSTYRLILPEKGLRWVQNMSRPERLDNGDVVWDGMAFDISDRVRIEEKQQRQLDILENTSDFIGTADADGNILYLNEAWQQLLQRDRKEPASRLKISEQHPAWAFDIIVNEALPTAEQQGMWCGETALLDGNGQEVPVSQVVISHKSNNGDVEYFSTVIRDMSDRKQDEMALEKEALRRSAVFNASADGIHILDRAGNLIEANEGFAKMLGYSLAEVSQLNITDWDAQWSAVEIQEMLQASFQNYFAGMQSSLETLHRRKDGSVFPVEISVCFMEWNGEFTLVCISRDISERKMAETKLKRTNQELARATRLKDEFLANMSHELRTPLNAILGMTEGLQDEVFGPVTGQQLTALAMIEQSGSHLLELINEILDLAKIEAGNIELSYSTVSITHLCQSSLTFIKQQSLTKGIQLHLKTPWDLPSIRVDERRIRQVLINLLNNAVKFTPAGGSVTLIVEPSSPNETHGQPYLRFSVTDTGIGIGPDELSNLFQPFVQIDSALNRQYEGTGLGLALVKRIVELHGGQVTVTSEINVGSCFTIELPYDKATLETTEGKDTPALPSATTPNIKPPTTAPLILLAEDNEANIVTISSYLQAKDYRILVATNGQEAIELAQAEVPHIILMDIQMPDLDGLSAIAHIRQLPNLKHISIIALTAFAKEEDKTRCLAAGADKYLSKPVKLKQLAAAIQALIS